MPASSTAGSTCLTEANFRSRARIEQIDKQTLAVRELPYGVTTTSLKESILKANDKGKIKIKNMVNDNYDYYYIKKADASRIYGLELEHIVSPNKINFFVDQNTLVEEHIMGIPGDQFLGNTLLNVDHNKVRLAKEFVKFNERSFLRLLGDMRSYNFVIELNVKTLFFSADLNIPWYDFKT